MIVPIREIMHKSKRPTCRVAERNLVMRAFTMGVARISLIDGRFSCKHPRAVPRIGVGSCHSKAREWSKGIYGATSCCHLLSKKACKEMHGEGCKALFLLGIETRPNFKSASRHYGSHREEVTRNGPYKKYSCKDGLKDKTLSPGPKSTSRGMQDRSCAPNLARPVKAQVH